MAEMKKRGRPKKDSVKTPPSKKEPKASKKFMTQKREEFLFYLSQTGNATAAADTVGIELSHLYRFRLVNPEIEAGWSEAIRIATLGLEGELFRRATGWDEPLYQGGQEVGTIRKQSDTCLIFALKGRMREIYGEQSKVDHVSSDKTMSPQLSEATTETLIRLEKLCSQVNWDDSNAKG
jgi:hypothetical protein